MSAKPFVMEMLLHFDDGDPAGILFFPNYFRIAQRVLEFNLKAHGVPWAEWFDHPEWGVPLRHVSADFKRPLRPGQVLRAEQGVRKLGDSSLVLETRLFNGENELCCLVSTTHVFVDKQALRKRPIPEHLRRFLESQQLAQ